VVVYTFSQMPLPSHISCEERARLLLDYKREIETYSTVVADLTRLIRVITFEDYYKLFRTADLARKRSEVARQHFENHVAYHECHF
jgi:hypothetical protein